MKAKTVRADKLKKQLKMVDDYKELKPIYDKMKSIHWKGRREKYQQEHDAALRRFQMIKRKLGTFKTDKGTLPIKE